MAVTLGSTAKVDWGDLAATNGLTAFTLCVTVKPSASPTSGHRYCGPWGGGGLATGILVQASTSSHYALAVGTNGSWLRIYRATTTAGASGTQNRIVIRWNAGVAIKIMIDGTDQSITTDTSVGSEAAIGNSTAVWRVGYESETTTNAVPGDYSEFALFGAYLPDWFATAYCNADSPEIYTLNRLHYCPLFNTSDIRDRWGGVAGTNSSGTNGAHPGVRYPWKSRSSTFTGTSPPPPPPSTIPVFMHHYRQQRAS